MSDEDPPVEERRTVSIPPRVKAHIAKAAHRTADRTEIYYAKRDLPVRVPEEERNEFVVEVRASPLRRARQLLERIADQESSWTEPLLAASTLAWGGTLSAIVAGVGLGGWRTLFFYTFLPIVGAGAGVGWWLVRTTGNRAASELARRSLDALPDPENTYSKEEDHR